MKKFAAATLTALVMSSHAIASEATPPSAMTSSHACRTGEAWTLGTALPESAAQQFMLFLGKKMPAVRGFSEALALRRQATTLEQKYFGEYWVSRALYGSKLVHIAKEGFVVLASRPVTDATIGIQLSALECLSEIHNRFPAIDLPKTVTQRLPDYLAAARRINHPEPVWDALTTYAFSQLSRTDRLPAAEAERLLSMLSGSGAHEALVKGMLAAQRSDHSTTIQELRKFLAAPHPETLNRYNNTANMLTARALYSVGQFEASIQHFKQVSKSSNELATSLEELSWSYLMAEQYKEAIGTAMNLQAGGLRKTFAPEAPMVMAMAMNEICQFPESVKAANVFRKNYEDSFRWLGRWKSEGRGQNLYKLAIQYLKKQGTTPDRVASEWVRSPIFISNQDEINLLFDEKDSATSLNQWGSREQLRLATDVLTNLRELKPAFSAARAKMKPGEELPFPIRQNIAKLKEDLVAFRRMQRAAPVWKAVLANHQKQASTTERRLADEINSDLVRRSARMHDQIEEIAENVQLIEVEIYNGASEDIIWQNAHPEYKKMARDLDRAGTEQNRSPASKVWNWGQAHVSQNDENVEIWEDELGSFKADLVDNCSSKDKYLALRLHPGARSTN